MFKKAGSQLEVISTLLFWLIAVSSLICGLYFADKEENFVLLILWTIGGSLSGYVFSLLLHGFGSVVRAFENDVAPVPAAFVKKDKPKKTAGFDPYFTDK